MTNARQGYCRDAILTPRETAAVWQAATHYDFLAWLFNEKHIAMPSARRFWTASMLESYEFAALEDLSDARERFPNLRKFKFSTPEGQRVGATVNC